MEDRREELYQYYLQNKAVLEIGHHKKRFKRIPPERIKYRVLLAIMMVRDVKVIDLAEMLNIHRKTVSEWLYKDKEANEENQKKVADIFGYPPEVLFFKQSVGTFVERPSAAKFFKTKAAYNAKNEILAGLHLIHDFSVADVADKIGISPSNLRRWMYKGVIPTFENQAKAAFFFKMPMKILFTYVKKV